MATITDSWTELSTTGLLIQKQGTVPVALAYAATSGGIVDTFGVHNNNPQLFPSIDGKNIYAKTQTGKTEEITFEALEV
jgi:hypothetical protein